MNSRSRAAMALDSPSTAAFLAALNSSLAEPTSGVDPEYRHYFAGVTTPAGSRSYLRHKAQMVSLLGGVEGKVVADIGSGFGVIANLMAFWGARAVYAVDRSRPRLTSHARLLRTAFRGLDQVHPMLGSADALPLDDASVDALFSNEAISHYADVDGFLDECARVMRPGGRLIISDGNNGANPWVRTWTEGLWERCENGPGGSYGTHTLDVCYRERREGILRRRFPGLPPERLTELARATSGLSSPALEDAVAAHLAGGPAPASYFRRDRVPVAPETGTVMERLFDPPALAADIARRGFEARAIPHYGGARGGLVEMANAVLSRVPDFHLARGFRIVARRHR
jgi:SAM-dependent methyltransferase